MFFFDVVTWQTRVSGIILDIIHLTAKRMISAPTLEFFTDYTNLIVVTLISVVCKGIVFCHRFIVVIHLFLC